MPNNDGTKSARRRSGRGRRPSLAPREMVLGLDKTEYQVSMVGVMLAGLTALIPALDWIRKVKNTVTEAPSKSGTCANGYHLVSSLCQKMVDQQSQWAIKFFFVLVVGLCLLYTTLRRKRAGVACFAIFMGLAALSISGVLFFGLGAWLMLRAYRLQKYGVAGQKDSTRVAKEMSAAKREGRAANLEAIQSADGTAIVAQAVAKPAAAPEASKRYTPKKPKPRRR